VRIGIIRTSSIGDVVLATACLDYLRQVAPEAEIIWVGRQPSLQLIQQSWPNLVPLALPSKHGVAQYREAISLLSRCDAVIDLQTSFRTRRMTAALTRLGIPVFSADKYPWRRLALVLSSWVRGRLTTVPAAIKGEQPFQYRMMLNALHRALVVLKRSSLPALEASRPHLPAHPAGAKDETWAHELSFGQWLAVAPGASYETKRAPTEVFSDILRCLASQWSSPGAVPGLVFVGGPEDRTAATVLMDEGQWPSPVINLAGKLSLDQTRAVLAKAKTLLSNDSGLAHIAEAAGTPVCVLFGPTSEAFGFPPQRADSRAFSANIGCRPCSKHGKQPCRYGDQMCFRSLDLRRIAARLEAVLSGKGDL
jgi:heptosyltransferase II